MRFTLLIVILFGLLTLSRGICPNGFTVVGNDCLTVSTAISTGDDEALCESINADSQLLTIEDEAQLTEANQFMVASNVDFAFIGLSRLNYTRSQWTWGGPTDLNDSVWYKFEPLLGQTCACLCRSGICRHKIVACDCTTNYLSSSAIGLCFGVLMPNGDCYEDTAVDGFPLVVLRKSDLDIYMTRYTGISQLIRIALYRHLYHEFVDGSGVQIDKSLWEEHEPDTNSCVYLGGQDLCASGKICDHACSVEKLALCEHQSPPPCPSRWTEISGVCYRATAGLSGWNPGECTTQYPGSVHVGIKTATEFQALYNSFTGTTTAYWLNLTRFATARATSQWSWFNSTEAYTESQSRDLWDIHHPNSFHSCTIMSATGLKSWPCQSSTQHLCEDSTLSLPNDCVAANGYIYTATSTCFVLEAASIFLKNKQCNFSKNARLAILTDRLMHDTVYAYYGAEAFVGLTQIEVQTGWEWRDPNAFPYNPTTFDIWKDSGTLYPLKNDSCAALGTSCERACSQACNSRRAHICQMKAIPPTAVPTLIPTLVPPTLIPTLIPTESPKNVSTLVPTLIPTNEPSTGVPTTGNQTNVPVVSNNQTNVPITSNQTSAPVINSNQTSAPSADNNTDNGNVVTSRPTITPASIPGVETTEAVAVVAAGAGAVTALVSPSAAVAASQMALILSGCHNETDWQKVPRMMHPLQITIHDNIFVGAVICNIGLVVVVTALHAALTSAFLPVFARFRLIPMKSFLAGQGLLRVPSASLFVFIFLYQGTVFSSMKLALSLKDWFSVVVGIFGWAVCFFVPVAVSRKLSALSPVDDRLCLGIVDNPASKCRYRLDTSTCSKPVITFFIGSGEWVSTDVNCKWDDRYTVVLRPFTERAAWIGAGLPFMLMTFLGLVNTMPTSSYTACGNVKLCSGICYIALTGVQCVLRPYARPRDRFLEPLISAVFSVDLFIMAYGFYMNESDGPTFDVAAILSQVAVAVVMLKAGIDLVTEIYVLYKKRRDLLQEEEYRAIHKEGSDLFSPSINDDSNETPLLTRSNTKNINDLLCMSLTRKGFGSPNTTKWTSSSTDSIVNPNLNVLLPVTSASKGELNPITL